MAYIAFVGGSTSTGHSTAVVLVSLDEWNAVTETLHFPGSASNAR